MTRPDPRARRLADATNNWIAGVRARVDRQRVTWGEKPMCAADGA